MEADDTICYKVNVTKGDHNVTTSMEAYDIICNYVNRSR